MRVKTIVYPKGGEPSRHTLLLTRTQIEDLCSQDAKFMKVLLNHDKQRVIGFIEKLEMDKHGRMIGFMNIKDKEAKELIKEGKLIGSSIGTDMHIVKNPKPTVIKKVLHEISLTDNPDRKESLIKEIHTKGHIIRRTKAGVYKFIGTKKNIYRLLLIYTILI